MRAEAGGVEPPLAFANPTQDESHEAGRPA